MSNPPNFPPDPQFDDVIEVVPGAAPPPKATPPATEPGGNRIVGIEVVRPAPAPQAPPATSAPPTAPGAPVAIARTTLEGTEAETNRESIAVATQAKAMVAARYLIAQQRRRDPDDARVRLLETCKRRAFAEAAIYKKPQGDGKVEGPSIRFAEECVRLWGNVACDVTAVFDDDAKRTVRITVTDLESNTTFSKDTTFTKTVERKTLRRNQQALGQRINSKGEVVFIVQATEDELLQKENAASSKAIRNFGLRLVPADIKDEALAVCRTVVREATASDPNAARKAVADAFAAQGILPSDLKLFLGHDLAQCSPAELEDLRGFYSAIRDGELTWKDVMDARQAPAEPPAPAEAAGGSPEAPDAKAAPSIDAVRERLRQRAQRR